MITENLSTLKINKLTQAQYDRELKSGSIDESALYLTPEEEIDLSGYATIDYVDSKIGMVKVWENDSFDSAFEALTYSSIGIPYSEYNVFLVHHKFSTTSSGTRVQLAMRESITVLDAAFGNNGNVASRAIVIKPGAIIFNDAYFEGAVNNNYIIPVAIYGLHW